jgi:hypothetical protein
MPRFWVVDTKAKILPGSSFEQDGSDFYYGRSVVPADTFDSAVKELIETLKAHCVEVVDVSSVVDYSTRAWDSEHDDFFDTKYSYEVSKETNSIRVGVFASEETLREW